MDRQRPPMPGAAAGIPTEKLCGSSRNPFGRGCRRGRPCQQPDVADPGVRVLDDLDPPAQGLGHPGLELAFVPAVDPRRLQPREAPSQRRQELLGARAVARVGRADAAGEDEAAGVDEEVAHAAVHLLAAVVAARPPFSEVFTDWLPRIAALGWGFRPVFARARAPSAAATRSHVPSSRHRRNHQETVDHGGSSWGSARHWQPVRRTERIAATSARRSWGAGWPPGLGAGVCGARAAHWASVRSLGSGRRGVAGLRSR